MKKFFFFPLWRVEKIEKELSDLEQKGWHLDRISFFNCFHFVESSPRKASYFFTYRMIKEKGMADTEHFLKSKLGASPVNGSSESLLFSVSVYRIVSDADLQKPSFYRNIYLQHLVGQKIILGLGLPIISVLLLILQFLTSGTADMSSWMFLGLMDALCLFYCIYQFAGLRQLKKRYQIMLPHISISHDDFLP